MTQVEYAVNAHVATITLNDGENRFNPGFLDAFLTVLDEIESATDATTLVVTSSHEKIFSNGIDLEWLVPVIQQNDIARAKDFFYLLNRMFKRIATFPLVTVASISGSRVRGRRHHVLCLRFSVYAIGPRVFLLSRSGSGDPLPAGHERPFEKGHAPLHGGVHAVHRRTAHRRPMPGASYYSKGVFH